MFWFFDSVPVLNPKTFDCILTRPVSLNESMTNHSLIQCIASQGLWAVGATSCCCSLLNKTLNLAFTSVPKETLSFVLDSHFWESLCFPPRASSHSQRLIAELKLVCLSVLSCDELATCLGCDPAFTPEAAGIASSSLSHCDPEWRQSTGEC